jgi:putative autotransporter adhesin-like protein
MLKIIISFTKLVLALVVTVLIATSCDLNVKTIVGSGNVTTETRNVGSFTGVDASKGLDIVIEQADVASVTVEADDNLQKHISTTVENGILKITSEYNSYTDVASKKVTVKMPVISRIETSSGVSLTSKNTLKSDDLQLHISSGSEMAISVEADKVTSETSSGSSLNLNGKALSYESSASSGSETDAGKLLANDVIAQASSGSSITVHPILSFDGKASSGSSVGYNNEPKTLKKKESSGGSVSKE